MKIFVFPIRHVCLRINDESGIWTRQIKQEIDHLSCKMVITPSLYFICLQELCQQLQSQDEQAESLLEDVHVLASITGPESLQSLSVEGIQLQEKVRKTHQLFSEVEEQTERNMCDLDR